MTILNEPVAAAEPAPSSAPSQRKRNPGGAIISWVTSTDHKVIGYMYLITATFWFFAAGLMALAIRAELAAPGLQFMSLEQYNQMFTMHGTIMLFLFATPLFVGCGNVIMPL
ncbi:MAG: cbb3-type cytochrome c oxidase subunit I, partial [Candidatus Nanopelagicales bacterium]